MLKRPFKSVIARIAIFALALSLVVPFVFAPAAFAQDASLNYAENGTGPVATFAATDQDGDPIEWSLGGADADLFTIDGGVLAFKKSPDYENPNSQSVGTRADKNVYNVTVEATGGMLKVVVTVTNVDEAGKITLNKPQPQVGRGLEATLADQDGGVTDDVWQWARSEDGETWTDIEGATRQTRNPVAEDVGSYLRASVTYTDIFGSGKTASSVTENRVEARTVSNASPSFEDQDDTAPDVDDNDQETGDQDDIVVGRSVAENTEAGMNIGKPVSATDADNDILIYTLGGTVDIDGTATPATDLFSINSSTGQLKTKAMLNFEGGDANPTGNTYAVMVTATDPSTAPASQPVTITLTDVNEAPDFTDASEALATVTVAEVIIPDPENPPALPDLNADYVAVDPDQVNNAAETVTYALEGADAEYFMLGETDGALALRPDDTDTADVDEAHRPNYEEKSSYSITIVAMSGVDSRLLRSRLDVTVKVTDAEDAGTVSLSQREPQEDQTVVATVSDPDGGVTITSWAWARVASTTGDNDAITCPAATAGGWTGIANVSSAAYNPTMADRNMCLRATATYTDNIGTDTATPAGVSERPVQISDPANSAPKFGDQDLVTIGDQSDEATRSVAENQDAGETVGNPLTATDMDLLLYNLSGPDAGSFKVDKNGQITTTAKLDFEAQATHTVVLNAMDPSGAVDSILVTINVTDENDPAVIAGPSGFDYAENGTGPVATFSATDQDGDPIEWSLGGADADLFTIGGGVLAFKSSPDYEDPQSQSVGTRADKNVYNVTVEATGGMLKVVVTVTNVDEAGKITLNKPQPQVGRGLEATLADQDGGVTDDVWQWARSEDGETWTDIEGATRQTRNPVAEDVGSYLRASVTYTDIFGSGKTASSVTENRVEARTVSNASPSFEDQDDTAPDVDDNDQETGDQDDIVVGRSVAENTEAGMNIGKPVSATDADNDILIYTLGGTVDIDGTATPATDLFSINSSTGQLKTKAMLNFEGGDANPTGNTYAVMVTATDPSTAPASQPVTITLTDVNEAPDFTDASEALATVTVAEVIIPDPENPPALPDLNADYVAVDPDQVNNAAETVTYALEGADAEYFMLGETDGALALRPDDTDTADVDEAHRPNYEEKSSYSITIVAMSGVDSRLLRSRLDVTVKVTDAEDAGTVSLSQREPQEDQTVVATVSDPDGGVTITSWAWARVASTTGDNDAITCPAATAGGWTGIANVSSAAYNPTMADRNMCLRATATYTDNIGTDTATPAGVSERPVQISDPANSAPKFGDQDLVTIGDQSDEATRSVAENQDAGETVGNPLTATDMDLLLYNLSGPDAGSFKVDKNGQITTTAKLDFEAQATYTVVVNAMDPSGATDSILVTINVTDEDDGAAIQLNVAPAFADDSADRSVAEDSEAGTVGDPVAATDSNAGDSLTYALSGDDADSFSIDDSGQISVGADTALDFESKASYSVTVTATDKAGASDSIDVTISVTNVNEAPSAEGESAIDYAENGTDAVGTFTASDPDDGDTITWSLSGADEGSFSINEDGILSFAAAPDFETPGDADTDNAYEVTVTATDSGDRTDSMDVTVTVTNMNEAPTASGEAAVEYAENGTDAVGTYMATDPDDGDTITWSLSGADAGSFTISEDGMLTFTISEDGMLTFAAPSTDEDSDDANGDDSNGAEANGEGTNGAEANGEGMNGAEANGEGMNGAEANGEDMNGAEANGEGMNGAEANGEGMNGAEANGEGMNGAEANGEGMNGAEANGEGMNGAEANGEGMNGAEANGEGMNGAEAVPSPDYEMPGDADGDNAYEVTVTATDSGGAMSSVDVTVTVTDVDENNAPAFAAETAEISVEENSEAGANVGDPVVATDADEDELTYELGGDDAASFAIWPSGQITVAEGASLDYETQTGYSVTVTATDAAGASDSIAVNISVTDVDENNAPAFDGDTATVSVDENAAAMANVGDPIVATDADEDELTYELGGDDAASFAIWPSGQITVAEGTSLDYETQASYSVTVTATDAAGASDSIDVTINVNDLGLANAYDADDSGDISKDEAVKAVQDYFEDTITRGEALEVLQLYFG